ncbi:MAG: 4Fe-4S binding protein, partial [Kiritimatiellae bacterium]|nr:4Fe-4S binding protein [Kiritimatiellia bacterium]
MDKNRRAQLLRHGVQLAAFLLAPALFATVLGALGRVVTSVAGGSPAGLAAPLLTLGVVLLVTALWGRVFCGWLCAFGALGEALGFVARRLRIPQLPRSVKVDRALRWVKYAVLAFLVVAVWPLALPIDASWSPWSAFGLLTSRNPSVMRAALATVGGALLLGIVVTSLFVERFFCRCLCPLGALLAPVSRLRLFRVTRKAGCTGCAACTRACPMNVPVHESGAANSGECIGCLRCTGA